MSGFQNAISNLENVLFISVVSLGNILSSRNEGYKTSLQNIDRDVPRDVCSRVAPADSLSVIAT